MFRFRGHSSVEARDRGFNYGLLVTNFLITVSSIYSGRLASVDLLIDGRAHS